MRRTLRPTRRRLLYEEVTDALLDDIRTGHYPEGSALPAERELMELFGVGRPSVREALAKLGRLGVIELKPGVRPRVRKPDMAPLLNEMQGAVYLFLADSQGQQHLKQLRQLFECALVRYAALNINDKELEHIQQVLNKQALVLKDHKAWAELDIEFHKTIAQIPDNPVLIVMQQSLASWLLEQSVVSLQNPEQPEIALKAHQNIYEALCRKDPNMAEQAMHTHLQQVYSLSAS